MFAPPGVRLTIKPALFPRAARRAFSCWTSPLVTSSRSTAARKLEKERKLALKMVNEDVTHTYSNVLAPPGVRLTMRPALLPKAARRAFSCWTSPLVTSSLSAACWERRSRSRASVDNCKRQFRL